MPERTFRSPGFFDQEIDLSQRQQAPIGVPAGVIGTAERGPAFVPVTVGSFADFKSKFGNLNSDRFGPYAVNEFLKNRTAVTYMRVLGAGANESTGDIETTRTTGAVKNAGFRITGSSEYIESGNKLTSNPGAGLNGLSFLVAKHVVAANETYGIPMFTDNDSFNSSLSSYNLVRGVIFTSTGTRAAVSSFDKGWSDARSTDISAIADLRTISTSGLFKFYLSSSDGSTFATTDNFTGLKVLTCSLDPSSDHYISKVMNTNARRFSEDNHLLYLDFAVDAEVASGSWVGIVSGSTQVSEASSKNFRDIFGRFDTRYTTPSTTQIMSQPFGEKEFNLFRVESRDDGAYANSKIKISISSIQGSTNPASDFGSFALLVRDFDDTDQNPEVLEQFPNLSLDPTSDRYIAKIIGDTRARFNFDADSDDERRLIIEGKYPNVSSYVRVVMHNNVESGQAPDASLPFGFRGPKVLKTNDNLDDYSELTKPRLYGSGSEELQHADRRKYAENSLTGSILPPLPLRYKVTKGNTATSEGFVGQPGSVELTDGRFYWGVKFERNNTVLNPNPSSKANKCVEAYTKFQGLELLDALVTGSSADTFNNNKFSLSRVALNNTSFNQLTASLSEHMRETTYMRNSTLNSDYTITDPVSSNSRMTFAYLLNSSSAKFNQFTDFAKFTTIMHGGFDGVNILDKNSELMNDKASSQQTGGGATTANSPGMNWDNDGDGKDNNAVFSFIRAADVMTDPMSTRINILAIPGIREPFVTNHVSDKVKDNGTMMYVMDIAKFGDGNNRLFDDATTLPSVSKTREQFDTRAIDNNYVATYFPDVVIDDEQNNERVKVPSSIAVLGAYSFNDKVGYPWFAPAGFNRAALDFVKQVEVRLSANDRDNLYDSKINPIATFPRQGIVIFGQKTLQFAQTALNRVNVRRLMIEVKRQISKVAEKIVFEQNDQTTRDRFTSQVTPLLAIIQNQAGIEDFRVVMDDTNNSIADVENNRLNGQIILVPTRAVEFIAIDFIITNSGVSFE